MDIMRTLLIYMATTMTLSVQATTAPKVTPAPTPVAEETAIVETADGTPAPGAMETIDASLTAVPPEMLNQVKGQSPAPVPTITPNTKAYHNLGMGAKGKEVRKLQERLIEMGYLPEGAADGAYGRQTYNAVKKFQRYNGLRQDGVAGRATQTNLFENPDIVRNPDAEPTPAKATETPAPTEAPAVTDTPVPVPTPEVTAAPAATEAPEVTEAPKATEAPEATEEPKATEAPEATEKPEATEAPEATEEPADTEEPPEIIENVDLDADVYEPVTGSVALNEGNGPLEFVAVRDNVPVTARPRLAQNGARIRVSLDDLCECVEGWKMTDDGIGTVVLEAAGHTLAIYNEDNGCSATVDGVEIAMKEDDFDFLGEGHFINADFLAAALKGEAVWDQEESTLLLKIPEKMNEETGD